MELRIAWNWPFVQVKNLKPLNAVVESECQ